MITIPLFDALIEKSNITQSYDKKQIYTAMCCKLLNPLLRRKDFYTMVPDLTSRQHIDLYTNMTTCLQVLLWNQYLGFLYKFHVQGSNAIVCSKLFGVDLKNASIFRLLNYVDFRHIESLQNQQAPMTHKEVENFIVENYNKSLSMINTKAYKKLLFLEYNNTTDMESLVGHLKYYTLQCLYGFAPLYRGEDLGKMLNKSLQNEVINMISYYKSGKRSQSTSQDEQGMSHNTVISLLCSNGDGDESNLLNIIGDDDSSYIGLEIAGGCESIYENFVHTEANTQDSLVKAKLEVMRILKNDNPAFLLWYNNKYNDDNTSILDICTERNFLPSLQNYLKLKRDQFMALLEEIKPMYLDLLKA